MQGDRKFGFSGVLVAPLVVLVACGGGGGGGTSEDPTGVEESALSGVPVAGQFLSECENGVALIDGFVASTSLSGSAADLPSAEDVLASGDPDTIPVLGGLVPASADASDLEAVDIDATLAMIPAGGLDGDLPVLGTAPVTCDSAPALFVPDPASAPGLVPVFDEQGEVIGLVLVTVGADDDVVDVGLPGGTDLLPEPFPSTIGELLETLGPITGGSDPEPTPGSGSPAPEPTPQPQSGQTCGGPWNIACPSGQICPALPGEWGQCQALL